MSCECYQIGGPWIAEDPNCELHSDGGIQDQLEAAEQRIRELEREVDWLRDGIVKG